MLGRLFLFGVILVVVICLIRIFLGSPTFKVLFRIIDAFKLPVTRYVINSEIGRHILTSDLIGPFQILRITLRQKHVLSRRRLR